MMSLLYIISEKHMLAWSLIELSEECAEIINNLHSVGGVQCLLLVVDLTSPQPQTTVVDIGYTHCCYW